jgi:tight adherence protein B
MDFLISNLPVLVAGSLLVVGLGVVGLILNVGNSSATRERLEIYGIEEQVASRGAQRRRANVELNRLRARVNRMLSSFASEQLNLALLSANWPITETEYILLRIWLTLAGFALGWLLSGSPIPGLGLAVLGLLAPSFMLQRAIHGRRTAFAKQLSDVLVLLTGAVRGGYSLPQALDFVSKEVMAPASEEFRRVQFEVSVGLPLSQALQNLSLRMQNDDLALLVAAININIQVGGNLVTMMRSVSNTIRERIRLYGEIRVLTSQQRFSSYLLSLIPFGVFATISILNPSFASQLLQPEETRWLCFPIGALISTLLGNFVISRMIKIQV